MRCPPGLTGTRPSSLANFDMSILCLDLRKRAEHASWMGTSLDYCPACDENVRVPDENWILPAIELEALTDHDISLGGAGFWCPECGKGIWKEFSGLHYPDRRDSDPP
jgi:uncharacterized protein with PIN domain